MARPSLPATPSTPGSNRTGGGPNSSPVTTSSQRFRRDFATSASSPSRLYSMTSQSDSRLTPRPTRGSQSSGTFKRQGTAAEEFQRHTAFGSPRSLRTFSDFIGGNESLEVIDREQVASEMAEEEDEAWEGLENVRACCDGKHDGELRTFQFKVQSVELIFSSACSRSRFAQSSGRLALAPPPPPSQHVRLTSLASSPRPEADIASPSQTQCCLSLNRRPRASRLHLEQPRPFQVDWRCFQSIFSTRIDASARRTLDDAHSHWPDSQTRGCSQLLLDPSHVVDQHQR